MGRKFVPKFGFKLERDLREKGTFYRKLWVGFLFQEWGWARWGRNPTVGFLGQGHLLQQTRNPIENGWFIPTLTIQLSRNIQNTTRQDTAMSQVEQGLILVA